MRMLQLQVTEDCSVVTIDKEGDAYVVRETQEVFDTRSIDERSFGSYEDAVRDVVQFLLHVEADDDAASDAVNAQITTRIAA